MVHLISWLSFVLSNLLYHCPTGFLIFAPLLTLCKCTTNPLDPHFSTGIHNKDEKNGHLSNLLKKTRLGSHHSEKMEFLRQIQRKKPIYAIGSFNQPSQAKATLTPTTLFFPPYVGSDPACTVHPQKYQEFQTPKKNIWNFSNPKKYPNSVPWP